MKFVFNFPKISVFQKLMQRHLFKCKCINVYKQGQILSQQLNKSFKNNNLNIPFNLKVLRRHTNID